MDGTIERYGYPGTPGLAELYNKYGEIPQFMATDHPEGHLANPGYLARWEAISQQAQREFHQTVPNVRAVIFPGDSRVIGIPVSGKPKVYDMDNDAAVERTEFEQLYGKLPDCVPKAGNNTDAKGDTLPHRVLHSGPDSPVKKRMGTVHFAGGPGQQPLIILNGRAVPNDTLQNINSDSIASIEVFKDSGTFHSIAFRKYGDRANNGIIVLHLKSEKPPLCLVDGREMTWDAVKLMVPDEIESMQVLKPEAALATYGEKAKNGVILVTLKKKSSP
jgi:TonB-dependent SusC/RagA subfamily outer membrane receptor